MNCINCEDTINASWEEIKETIQEDYTFSDAALDSGDVSVKLWHPKCAVADRRVNDIEELGGAKFYWNARQVRV